MTLDEVWINAKQHTKACKVCPICNGIACRGEIPGLGGKGLGNSFVRNYEALRDIHPIINTIVEDAQIDTSVEIFGKKFSLPVYGAPIAGMATQYKSDILEENYSSSLIEGTIAAGSMTFTGDGKDFAFFTKPVDVIDQNKGLGIATIKPWEEAGIKLRTDYLTTKNVLAVACDIDAAGLLFLRNAQPRITNFSLDDIRKLKKACKKPLIIKGIMSVEGALKAIEAGCDGIVVSNHGGRVLDDSLATIEVLSQIKQAVMDRVTILIDGGFRSGVDVFKALALGADGVLIGRPLALAAIGGGKQGVQLYLNKIRTELVETMIMCGAHNIKEITSEMVIFSK